MCFRRLAVAAASAFLLLHVSAVGSDDQINAKIDYGSFANPSSFVRPRFRYWVPDASVNLTQVTADIHDAARIGAGGVELLPYYNYGGVTFGAGASVPTDWTQFGWGTPAWRQVQDAALRAINETGLVIDIALGPNQGAGVPAPYNSDGLQWDLQPFNVTVPIGGSFNATLPGWGTGSLVSASTALITKTTNATSATYKVLSQTSLMDVTGQVGPDGEINLQFPSDETGESYVLFAYYLVHSEYREQQSPELVIPGVPQSPVTSWVQNGSWVVDHFSARGAQTVIDFWEQHLLNGSDTIELLEKVGNYIWEDSQEFPANAFWTPAFPQAFEAEHGYEINKYLPLILHGNTGVVIPGLGSSASPIYYITDAADSGDSHIADYRQTLTELNKKYLGALTKWAQSLGIQSSAQVVYNLPMDMLANIPDVNAPETETLGFNHNIDSYRQFVGPANLAGKRIISSEAGAVMGSAYQQTIPELLWDLKRSVVAGINNFILHGQPYSGNYPNSTWPTWTTFFYLFSDMHNRHQPAWDFYGDWMNYTARLQYVSQIGVPKRDVVFWLKDTSYTSVPTRYEPTDLIDAGYSYEYLSPDNFDIPAAEVVDGVLAPTRQSFHAIIVRGNDTLTSAGVKKLSQWAHQGLPLVFSGGIPTNFSGTDRSADASANVTLSGLLKLTNVHAVPYAGLASSLAAIGIHPRTAVTRNATSATTWYTNRREDENQSTSYVFIYNDATGLKRGSGSSSGSISFNTFGTPFIYDAWTGEKTPVVSYSKSESGTTIPIFLAGNQTTIIAFERGAGHEKHRAHVKHGSGEIYHSNNGQIVNFGHSPCTATLSNGSTATLPASNLTSISLQNWNLTIESWNAPTDLYDVEATIRTNKTYTLPSLLPWNKIPGANLNHTSGRGYYTTSFTWPPSNSSTTATGAQLNLGSILHTARAFLNGHRLPPLDVTAAKADLTPYLRNGQNELLVIVATPLGNVLAPIWAELKSQGEGPQTAAGGVAPGVQEYGLVGEVVVVPFVGVSI